MRPALSFRVLALAAVLGAVVLCLGAAPATGQTGTLTAYFDPAWTQRTAECPGPVVGSIYIVAENWNYFLSGIEFKVEYPPCMMWLADLDIPPVTIGSSPNGVSIGWPLPQNGFFPIQVMRALVLWNCTGCNTPNQRITVVGHPVSGLVQVARFPDYALVEGRGRASVVCPDVALDIKPGSCPNPFNIKLFEWANGEKPNKGGVLPVAVLGSETFDVTDVDLSSLRLEGVEPLAKGGPKVSDVAGPALDGGECACTTAGPDRYPDIMMRFQSQAIAEAIAPGYEGDRELTLTGYYLDGIPFEAKDCIRIVGREYIPMEYTGEPALRNAFPNPFNPVTRLTYFVPEGGFVRVAVYDVTGRLVAELVNGAVDAGEHTVEWNAKGLASGVYFGRLETGGVVDIQRLVLLK
jgi:hypothetical protein